MNEISCVVEDDGSPLAVLVGTHRHDISEQHAGRLPDGSGARPRGPAGDVGDGLTTVHTLPDQFELLSDAWLAEATRVPRAGDRRGSRPVPFAVSECFRDAPPHLGLADDVAVWSARWDGTSLAVARQADEAADLVVEGTTRPRSTAAQLVGVTAPNAAEHMRREMAQQFGKDALRVRGRLPDRRVGELLARLHDHLGPAHGGEPGPAPPRGAAGPDRQDRARWRSRATPCSSGRSPPSSPTRCASTRCARCSEQTVSSLHWMLYQGRPFELLAQHAQLMTLIDASLGRGAVIGSLERDPQGPRPGHDPDAHRLLATCPSPTRSSR